MKKYAFSYQLAQEAVFLARYADAVHLLKPLSAAGDRNAQFLHSYLHFWDDDLPQTAAVDLMHAAADAGHIEANYVLAVCPDLHPGYAFSLPTTEKRLTRLRFAAAQGSADAQTDLAQCYLEGVVVTQDAKHARELLQEAYQQAHSPYYIPKTCLLLARLLLDGIGGEQAIDDGLTALWRCQFRYGDPLAAEAVSLFIEIAEQGLYRVDTENFSHNLPELRSELSNIRATHLAHWQRYIERYCRINLYYDLQKATFDEFIGFVFEHFHRSLEESHVPNWTQEAKVDFDARGLLRYYTQLFREPAFLRDRYTPAEIERGLGMAGIRGWGNWTLGCVLSNADNTQDEAEACIRAMYDLFAKLFAQGSLGDVSYMWWDVGYGACRSPFPARREIDEADHVRLDQATFETMVRVLQLESTVCQSAAIHGLGHSFHPDKEKVLRQFLSDHPDLSDGDRDFVMRAIAGKIL